MAALTLNSIRLCTLALGVALALAPPALAGDVSVQLDAGTGFSIKNSTGAIERLRVDEATGNISRNGALFVHTTGTNNTFVGADAGNTATTGFRQQLRIREPRSLSRSNTTGSYNSAVGYNALRSNTTGYRQLRRRVSRPPRPTPRASTTPPSGTTPSAHNTTGTSNSAVGYCRPPLATPRASDNSAVGHRRPPLQHHGQLQLRRRGSRPPLQHHGHAATPPSGMRALRYNTTGDRNSAVGMRRPPLQHHGQPQRCGRLLRGPQPDHRQRQHLPRQPRRGRRERADQDRDGGHAHASLRSPASGA